jgi:hypothetical protein
MPVRSEHCADRSVRRLRLADPPAGAPRVIMPVRDRVDVIAPNAARVVRFAGGWIFDQVAAGWDVAVHLTDPADARPLLILGAQLVELDRSPALNGFSPLPRILAVDVDLYESEAWVRRWAHEAVRTLTEVWLWGGERRPARDATRSVAHQLSLAARAFKAQALAAAVGPIGPMDTTELFRRVQRRPFAEVAS